MNRLSVTLITRDEERNLPRALASVAGIADEIVLVDSGSTDSTLAIAREAGAGVFERDWTDYGDQKNFAAGQASHDWILSLDADEELSPELRDSLRRWKETAPTAAAYSMPRRAYYLGGWVNHSGWYPDRKVRLYRRDRARFAGELHEGVRVEGPAGTLDGDLLHYPFRTQAEYKDRVERYATLAARQLFDRGRRHWLLPLLVATPWTFLHTYLLRHGFRDGRRGWQIARMTAYNVFLKYRKLGELARQDPVPVKPREAAP